MLIINILNAINEISLDDAKTDIEAITFNLIYHWLIMSDHQSLETLFAEDLDISFNDLSDISIDLLLNIKASMKISDGDLILDIIDISYNDNDNDNDNDEPLLIYDNGHYYFYNEKNLIVDGGKYEIIWKLSKSAPKYIIKSFKIKSSVNELNKNNLYFDEDEMGRYWIKMWDNLEDLNDKTDENMINKFLNRFSINFEFNFVDTKDIERILFGRKQFIEWMNNYDNKGLFGKDRLLIHKKEDDIMMIKISPWKSAFAANVVLKDRKTNKNLKEERWFIIMGYDVINRKFYRATQFYDEQLFIDQVNQIQKRFPFARHKLPKNEL